MYLDQILFLAGGILLAATLVLAVSLLRSRRRSRDYRQILEAETQRIDVISTLRATHSLKSDSTSSAPPVPVPAPKSTGPLIEGPSRLTAATELLSETALEDITELLPGEASAPRAVPGQAAPAGPVGEGLDLSPLKGMYALLREIHGGGMSRVFVARHEKLGNEWIVKFINGQHAGLANEAEVLKQLNHISLPQIIDIFQNDQGTFLVESYIEGYTLDEVLRSGQEIKEGQISDWGVQLAQVLRYLHELKVPIIHCDLKPSNIMVTHDNRLVLIDFGISKQQGVSEESSGITYRYAAPEQFRGGANDPNAIAQRFGTLPPEHTGWPIDERTDLYSVGVILYELLLGHVPKEGRTEELNQRVTPKLAETVRKCLEIQPEQRFQSAGELLQALEGVRSQRFVIARKLVTRRIASVCCGVFLVGGLITSASGAYIYREENLSVISLDPGQAVVSVQQSIQILIQKTSPNGTESLLKPSQVHWFYSKENIARIDGDRLVGLNQGETTLRGEYRNKSITLNVTVTEPLHETTSVSLRYLTGGAVSVFAGDGQREFTDGPLSQCSFVSPESLSVDGGAVWLSDSGVLRCVEDGGVSTQLLEPDFLTTQFVRAHGETLYLLTGPWEGEDEVSYYGILRLSGTQADFIYYTEAAWSVISDMALSPDGRLWFVQQNLGTGMTTLNVLERASLDVTWVMDLPDDARKMAFDPSGTLYISVPESGVILRVGAGEDSWSYFAGIEGERHFIDGGVPNFYRPTSLAADGSFLYVLDFDTVRRITVEGRGAASTETIAGIPTEDTDPEPVLGSGEDAVLPASELAELSLDGQGGLLLTDPKNSVIYQLRLQG